MKKALIGGLVGGIILFMWQFLSWSLLNIHGSQQEYTPKQDQILDCLKSAGISEGEYFMPNVSPDLPADQHQEHMMQFVGNPWAQVSYHNSMKMNMGMNMFRGFVINFLSVFLLCYFFLGDKNLDFKKVFTGSLIVGLISYMTIPYLNSIWFEGDTIPDLIDAVVQWGICGLFLAWYLPNRK